jgi:GTP:adenosylcobinamide-phosphate guanylyltransferase
MDGIVLAGARAPEELRDLGIMRVPLLRINGVTILERTCRAMLDAGCTAVFVLAPEEVELPADQRIRRAAYSGDVINDMFGCLEHEAAASHAILSSSDMPLITAEALGQLVESGRESGADIVYPAVERRVLEQRFPETKRTYVRLGALTVTGGNAVFVDRRWLLNRQPLIHELFANRKSIGKLAGFFGVWFLARLLLGFAPVDYVERHLGKLLSGKLKAAVLPSVELGIDLDKLADLELLKDMIDPWEVPAELN